MTTREKILAKYPGAILFGSSGEYLVVNACWNPVRALIFEYEAAAQALVRDGKCNAPTCKGQHSVVRIKPEKLPCDWEDPGDRKWERARRAAGR